MFGVDECRRCEASVIWADKPYRNRDGAQLVRLPFNAAPDPDGDVTLIYVPPRDGDLVAVGPAATERRYTVHICAAA